eukprot:GHUV01040105.1.p1 GENE.GHUV01040105.1~~GHUV01040105.1.p1  ORF type:complete len:221 (-),score=57.07 GHUV01040105.1:40-702(-)
MPSLTRLLLLAPLLFAAAYAARPLNTVVGSSSRSLLQWNRGGWGGGRSDAAAWANAGSWNGGGCPGPNQIGFGGGKFLAIPAHKLIAGNVQLYNRGRQPFRLRGAGFRIGGPRAWSPLSGDLRCPDTLIPAGGSLQCGFLANTPNPLNYNMFNPYFVPQGGFGGPCNAPRGFPIVPYYGSGPSSSVSNANAVTGSGQAKGLAEVRGGMSHTLLWNRGSAL